MFQRLLWTENVLTEEADAEAHANNANTGGEPLEFTVQGANVHWRVLYAFSSCDFSITFAIGTVIIIKGDVVY
jgi:hypothetical protein